MSERVLDRVTELADQFKEQAVEAEKLGQLPDATVKSMKAIGSIRLLQPKEHGGLEVHPREFAETVMATASLDPAAGWVNGIVGVHPWQLAFADPRVQRRSGATTSTPGWPRRTRHGALRRRSTAATSSTAAGSSLPAPTHCDWIFLGAMVGDKDGKPGDAAADAAHDPAAQRLRDRRGLVGRRGAARHRLQGRHRQGRLRPRLPHDGRRRGHGRHRRAQVGLHRDAVQDAVVDDVPARHHLRDHRNLRGRAGRPPGLPARARQRQGTAIKDDPYVLFAIGEAAAEIRRRPRRRCSPTSTGSGTSSTPGKEVTFEQRAAGAPDAGAGRVARGHRGRPDLRPLRRQRAAHGQAAAAVSGATRTRAWRTPSTCRAPSTTPRRSARSASTRRVRCGR